MGREEREPRATTITRCGTCELRATWEKEKKMYIPGPKIMYVNLVLLGYVPSRMELFYLRLLRYTYWDLSVLIIVLQFYDLSFKKFS